MANFVAAEGAACRLSSSRIGRRQHKAKLIVVKQESIASRIAPEHCLFEYT